MLLSLSAPRRSGRALPAAQPVAELPSHGCRPRRGLSTWRSRETARGVQLPLGRVRGRAAGGHLAKKGQREVETVVPGAPGGVARQASRGEQRGQQPQARPVSGSEQMGLSEWVLREKRPPSL